MPTAVLNATPGLDAPQTVLEALRRPQDLARAWEQSGTDAYPASIFIWLLVATGLATAIFGFVMGLPVGIEAALERGALLPLACGLSWSLALPTLLIHGGLRELGLKTSTLLLVATLTAHYAALALLASVPVHLFFAAIAGHGLFLSFITLLIFGGVGFCAADVMLRVMATLKPGSGGFSAMWLVLLGALGPELFLLFGIFDF